MNVVRNCGKLLITQQYRSLIGTVRSMSSLRSVHVSVGDRSIHVVRRGDGPRPILLMPGALGTAVTDLLPQLEGLDPNLFSIVGWDPPGYGQSRPPARDFTDFFRKDAEVAVATMTKLGFDRFSMVGWSDGGITAMCAAIAHPSVVERLVVWGSNAYIAQSDIDMIEKVGDVSQWSARMRAPMEEVYGVEGFPVLWEAWCQAYREYFDRGGDICSEQIHQIACPTLVIHGAKDVMVAAEHVDFLHEFIPFATKYIFEEGKHNLHLKYRDQFNTLVTDFLTKE